MVLFDAKLTVSDIDYKILQEQNINFLSKSQDICYIFLAIFPIFLIHFTMKFSLTNNASYFIVETIVYFDIQTIICIKLKICC